MNGFSGSFFKVIIITTVKQIITYFIEKMLMKIGISKVVITIRKKKKKKNEILAKNANDT